MQEVKADTTTIGDGNVDSRTSSARVTVPVGWAFASAIIGFILLMLGLAVSNPVARNDSKKDSYEKVVESKENIEVGDGSRRKIVRERTEKYNARKNDLS